MSIAQGIRERQTAAGDELRRRILAGDQDSKALLELATSAGMNPEQIEAIETGAAHIRKRMGDLIESEPAGLGEIDAMAKAANDAVKGLVRIAAQIEGAIATAGDARGRAFGLEARIRERREQLKKLRDHYFGRFAQNRAFEDCSELVQLFDEAERTLDAWADAVKPAVGAATGTTDPWNSIADAVVNAPLPSMNGLLRSIR